MLPVYAIATNTISSLGLDVNAHWHAVKQQKSGIRQYDDASLSASPFWGAKIDALQWQYIQANTKADIPLSPFEQLAIFSAKQALADSNRQLSVADTLVVLSTTKGNIEWLGAQDDERLTLYNSAKVISKTLGFTYHKPIVVSHACVSGVLALVYAMRRLQQGTHKHAVVIGCDRFSRFVLSGFQSFQAIADEPCKPFDNDRKGINLGECGAAIVLTTEPGDGALARLYAGGSSNDANHISGPSRTGEELALAIKAAISQAGITAADIDMISAHGTATSYNDEMEAKAFNTCDLSEKPVHSFKGYTGHTLGAAGILESAMIIESIRQQQLIPSLGFNTLGVSVPLNVTKDMQQADIKYVLKTASGFGGCNATAIWGRV
ncbi:MAG: beta-ketoacyl synthase [Flavipsychrobacter sp.]|nr:beta-ketoacyl synthase [Flavipsychrobacter sp.]